jgi:hypothetical protein
VTASRSPVASRSSSRPRVTATASLASARAATWDQTLAGRLVHRSLRDVYPQIVAGLAAAAEKQAARAQS